jgi:hypothetical protein
LAIASGIIEMSSAEVQTSAPAKIQTRTITLSELMMTVQISEVHELAERPADLSVPFRGHIQSRRTQRGESRLDCGTLAGIPE